MKESKDTVSPCGNKPLAFSREVENLIAQFRGLPGNLSRSTLRESKSINGILENCLKVYKIGEARPTDQIMANWKSIVGEKNAHRCCPKTLSRGNLVIAVANPVVRSELQFIRGRIMEEIRALPGCGGITGITFVAG